MLKASCPPNKYVEGILSAKSNLLNPKQWSHLDVATATQCSDCKQTIQLRSVCSSVEFGWVNTMVFDVWCACVVPTHPANYLLIITARG